MNYPINKRSLEEGFRKFLKYKRNPDRIDFDRRSRESHKFYLGHQWDSSQKDRNEERGQTDLTFNRIQAAIDMSVSILTANIPMFKAIPKGGANLDASIVNSIFHHIWHVSKATKEFENAVFKAQIKGLGCFLCDEDPLADNGKGELILREVDPKYIVIDPTSSDWNFRDAQDIYIYKYITLQYAKRIFNKFRGLDSLVTIRDESDSPLEGDFGYGVTYNPDRVSVDTDLSASGIDELLLVDWYFPVSIEVFYLFQLDNEGNPVAVARFEQDPDDIINQDLDLKRTVGQLMNEGYGFRKEQTYEQRIVKSTFLGEGKKLVSSEILPCNTYPMAFFTYKHLGNPYPMSKVDFQKGKQVALNKAFNVCVASALVASIPRLIMEEDAIPEEYKESWEKKYNQIGSVNFIKSGAMRDGKSVQIVSAEPLNAGFIQLTRELMMQMEYELGQFAHSMGDPSQAPDTAEQSKLFKQWSIDRQRPEMRGVTQPLEVLGEQVFRWIQRYYTLPKTIRLYEGKDSLQYGSIKLNQIEESTGRILNDVTVGSYDIKIIEDSVTPTNEVSELLRILKFFELGIIDEIAVLQRTDFPDRDDIIQRRSQLLQQQQQIQALTEQLEDVQATADKLFNEALTSKKREMTAEFGADIQSMASKLKEGIHNTLNNLKMIEKEAQLEKKFRGTPSARGNIENQIKNLTTTRGSSSG